MKKNIILYVGYLTGYKGIDLLLDGFAEYVKIDQNAFLIVGAGKHPKFKGDPEYLAEYRRLQRKAETLIDKSQYRWVGFIGEQDIVNYYSASDVSIYPYTVAMSSSGPMAFAIGYERPFLASDAFDKVIDNPEMIFQRTPNHLVSQLRVFFQDKKRFQSSIKRMKKERLWTKIGEKTYGLYLSLK